MNPTDSKILKISATTAEKLAKLHLTSLWDLLLHAPLRYEDETHITPLGDLVENETCLVEGKIIFQTVQFRPRKQLLVRLENATGHFLILRYLHFYPTQQSQLSEGKTVRALGQVRAGFYGLEMIHPKIVATEKSTALKETLTPVYPTVSGLNQATIRRAIAVALEKTAVTDTLPEKVLQPLNLPDFACAIHSLHAPTPEYSAFDLNNKNLPFFRRLKFDELLAQQLSMRLARNERERLTAIAFNTSGELVQRLLAQLSFKLTAAQHKVLNEIKADLACSHPMHRLLQGDVGSGKTIVAAAAALLAIEAGFQAALTAPTEILAEQHFSKFATWFNALNIPVAYLSGSLKKREKQQVKDDLLSGRVRFVIGTHALFQDDVAFENLGFVIVDEQHRFGVQQRLNFKNKGNNVHQLMMSATPIPRSLAMGFFADLDVSVIDEMPPNRTPVKTHLKNSELRRSEIEQFVRKIIQDGRQAYWVCPLIEESEALQLKTATETFERLSQTFPELSIGLVHGKMKAAEKAAVMQQFVSGSLNALVATTVIEVGVDVPNATLMVIEHAERMGLSQLHQLRGRVGRGGGQSHCVLLFTEPLSDTAKERLRIIYQNTDGFEIARQDLQLRGPGEFLGAKQSGVPLLRFADIERDIDLLETARDTAAQLVRDGEDTIIQQHLNRWLPNREEYLGV
ncbi:MAG: ATP-dependent DNA helicase RecG [Neisseriaceae bacterium]|nr:ATP-dependent DNA helicase RecG [Neisseriaceae bacterium]